MTNSLFDLPFEEPQEPEERGPQGSAPQETASEEITPEPRRVYSVSQLTDRIRTLLFVVDTTNTKAGASGRIWMKRAALQH